MLRNAEECLFWWLRLFGTLEYSITFFIISDQYIRNQSASTIIEIQKMFFGRRLELNIKVGPTIRRKEKKVDLN